MAGGCCVQVVVFLHLTTRGERTLAAINRHARERHALIEADLDAIDASALQVGLRRLTASSASKAADRGLFHPPPRTK